MNEIKNKKTQIFLPIIIASSIILGMFISLWMNPESTNEIIFKSSEKDKLSLVVNYIQSEYVDELDKNEIIEIAIPELLKTLDPHSQYINASEAVEMLEELEGEFFGIGVQFNIYNDTILVVNTINGGPSEKLGIKGGDRIIKINDSLVAGTDINNSTVMKLLKGDKGTKVKVDILRKGTKELIPYTITRDHIPLRSVDAEFLIDENIGFIKISNFSRATYKQFVQAILNLKKNHNINSVIIDLRDNSGGFLNAATNIVDEFLKADKLMVYTEGQARPKNTFLSTENRNTCTDLQVVVLINEFSASASEIVAGAIQDNDRGLIIGRRSFGKGLVQEAINFSDGSVMRLTTARYYTPSGRSIQKDYNEGIEEYYMDLWNRYQHGEFLKEDSIKFNDSLVYFTLNGRKVYGGGGIMPDIFVPADTTGYSNLLRIVRNNSYEYFFALDYVDNNRKKLDKFDSLNQLINHLEKTNIMNDFYTYLKQNKVEIKQNEVDISGKYIENNIHAYISRQMFGDDEFYKVFYKYNNTVNKAIEILKENENLQEYLN